MGNTATSSKTTLADVERKLLLFDAAARALAIETAVRTNNGSLTDDLAIDYKMRRLIRHFAQAERDYLQAVRDLGVPA